MILHVVRNIVWILISHHNEEQLCGFQQSMYGFSTAKAKLKAQAFRFMVGLGHCPMISKYGPSLSNAVGLVDPSF